MLPPMLTAEMPVDEQTATSLPLFLRSEMILRRRKDLPVPVT